jgi:hypothetical protein
LSARRSNAIGDSLASEPAGQDRDPTGDGGEHDRLEHGDVVGIEVERRVAARGLLPDQLDGFLRHPACGHRRRDRADLDGQCRLAVLLQLHGVLLRR